MATLLKLDSKIINLDAVFEIEDYGDRMGIFYIVASTDVAGTQQPAYAEIEGAPAQALRRWLAKHSIDLMAEAAGDAWAQPDRAPTGAHQQAVGTASDPSHLAQIHSAGAADPAAGDQSFYGAARIQQLRGAGSSRPAAGPTGAVDDRAED